ncbi:MAG TPA: MauE/DoxX family redox-associated membrane protein [Thermoanaerobaculia bacterium]
MRASASLRVGIGLVLLATAVGKFLDVPGFARVLETYRAFPSWSLAPLAWLIPIGETALAVWLFSGLFLRGAALASLALHGLYGGWSVVSIERGLRLSNCGCFGIFLARPLTWVTVGEDLVMAALSAGLIRLTRKAP